MDLGGTVQLSLFAYGLMAVVAMLSAVMVRGTVVVLQRMQQRRRAAPPPMPVSISVVPAEDETTRHVAAIAAAVYAVVGAHRLVHVGETARSPAWATTGRTMHQTSHAPRRTPR